jgi:hypothetical protein
MATSTIPPIINPVLPTPSGNVTQVFANLFSGLVGFLLFVATLWTFIQLILAGLQWISSGGDKGSLEEAQKKITNAVIGVFIVFAAWTIFILLMQFFGISKGKGGVIDFILPTLFRP